MSKPTACAAERSDVTAVELSRTAALQAIWKRLAQSGGSLRQAIREQQLYFRLSILGYCNLACRFCHNEGAPAKYRLAVDPATLAMQGAAAIGFDRLQLTGGEPLLHPEIEAMVAAGRRFFADVGVTTNGVRLPARLDGLIRSGLQRLHVSLQSEVLAGAEACDAWNVPAWLLWTLQTTAEHGVTTRINLPVPADSLPQAAAFLERLAEHQCDIRVFSVLPEGANRMGVYPLAALQAMVAGENSRRVALGLKGSAFMRGFDSPAGIRCGTCQERHRCQEQSHSLRLGADLVLRPCLASRAWDQPLDLKGRVEEQFRAAALLALDYV